MTPLRKKRYRAYRYRKIPYAQLPSGSRWFCGRKSSLKACKPPAPLPLILIADDQPDDVALIQHAIARVGAKNRIVALPDGMAAMDYLQRWLAATRSTWISEGLLLLDLKMPRAGGLDVLRWISGQPRLHGLKVIVLTHSTNPVELLAAKTAGAHECISKRARPEFQTSVQRALSEINAGADGGTIADSASPLAQ